MEQCVSLGCTRAQGGARWAVPEPARRLGEGQHTRAMHHMPSTPDHPTPRFPWLITPKGCVLVHLCGPLPPGAPPAKSLPGHWPFNQCPLPLVPNPPRGALAVCAARITFLASSTCDPRPLPPCLTHPPGLRGGAPVGLRCSPGLRASGLCFSVATPTCPRGPRV